MRFTRSVVTCLAPNPSYSEISPIFLGKGPTRADVPSRTSGTVFSRHGNALGVSNRIRSAIVERMLLWAFVASLAWCPFWFGSHALLAWGINAVLFPGLAAIYEVSLLIRGE